MKQMRGIEVLVLRNVVGMLGVLLHAPRGPFYSPRQLGAVESNLGRQFLPSIVWRTGQCPVLDFFP
jgi:predicted NUDIX family NTP pyrophosphohydrolase